MKINPDQFAQILAELRDVKAGLAAARAQMAALVRQNAEQHEELHKRITFNGRPKK
jgi:hypothetical protein